jgi:hypothetical protein
MGTLATGNLYRFGGSSVNYSTGLGAEQSNGRNDWIIGLVANTTDFSGGSIDLFMPNQTKQTGFVCTGLDTRSGGAGGRIYAGYLANTTAFTSFSLVGDGAATFTSCDITVYGYRIQ